MANLLSLPVELRMRIYELCFNNACVTMILQHPVVRPVNPFIQRRPRMIRNGTERIIDHSPLNIFFTCKQIYFEAMPMLESRMIAKVRLSGSVVNTFNPNHQFCQIMAGLGSRGYGMGLGFPGRWYTIHGQNLRIVALPINLLRYEGDNCFVNGLNVWMPNLELFLVYEIAATGFDADAVRLPSRAFSTQAEEEELWDVAVKRVLFSPAHLTHTGINLLHKLGVMPRNWDLVIEQHISPRKIMHAKIRQNLDVNITFLDAKHKLVPQQIYRDGGH